VLGWSWRRAINITITTWGELGTALAGIDLSIEGEEHLWSQRPAWLPPARWPSCACARSVGGAEHSAGVDHAPAAAANVPPMLRLSARRESES